MLPIIEDGPSYSRMRSNGLGMQDFDFAKFNQIRTSLITFA